MSVSDWISHISKVLVAHHLQMPLLFLLLALVFSEAAFFLGFVLPGETALVTGGFLAAHHVWSLGTFLLLAIMAAILGDSVGYEVGKIMGARVKEGRLGRLVGAKRWAFAEHLFSRYHGQLIFLGRAQALLRSIVPALAGMHRVTYANFLKWNAAGGILFSSVVVVAAYHFANYLKIVEKYLGYWSILIVVLFITALFLLKKRFDRLYDSL